ITLEREETIILPTAFTPNGDGLNDIFLPVIDEADSFEMKVFNRWGEILFYSNSIFEGWDGKYKRGTAQSGTYIYQISLKKGNGIVINQSGTFLLMK
ncbi:MAG: gliding motility-associated C-terminal domain-containing protein, partial [Cyclobacteriaceae bacterium]